MGVELVAVAALARRSRACTPGRTHLGSGLRATELAWGRSPRQRLARGGSLPRGAACGGGASSWCGGGWGELTVRRQVRRWAELVAQRRGDGGEPEGRRRAAEGEGRRRGVGDVRGSRASRERGIERENESVSTLPMAGE